MTICFSDNGRETRACLHWSILGCQSGQTGEGQSISQKIWSVFAGETDISVVVALGPLWLPPAIADSVTITTVAARATAKATAGPVSGGLAVAFRDVERLSTQTRVRANGKPLLAGGQLHWVFRTQCRPEAFCRVGF